MLIAAYAAASGVAPCGDAAASAFCNGPQSGYDATFPPPNMTLEECERRNSRSWRPSPLTPERVSCR